MSDAAKRYVEVTETMASNLDDVSKSLREINKYNSGLAKGFTELTKATKPFGRAWLAIGRFTSGTSFWRFQNRVKAISDILQFQELLLKKRLEAEDELTAKLGQYEGHLKTVKKTEEGIIKLQKGKLDFLNAESTLKSKYYKVLKAEFGTTTALDVLKQRAVKAQKKALEFEKQMSKPRVQAYKDEMKKAKGVQALIDHYENLNVLGKATTKDLERQKELKEELEPLLKSQFLGEEDMLKMSEKQLQIMLKLGDAVEERRLLQKARLEERDLLDADIAAAKTAKEKKAAKKAKKERMEEMDNELAERQKLIKEHQAELETEGISTTVDNRSKQNIKVDTSNIKQKGPMEKLQQYLKDSTAYKLWEKAQALKEWGIKKKAMIQEKGIRKFFSGSFKKGFMKILTATGKFLFFALQATLLFTLLIIFIIALHQAKILPAILSFIVGAFFFMGKIIELAVPVIDAIFKFISDIFEFINALFEGDGGKIAETGKKLLSSLGDLLLEMGKFLFNVAFEALDGLTGGLFTKAKEFFTEKLGSAEAAIVAVGVLMVGTLFVIYGMWLAASWLIAAATAHPITLLVTAVLGLFAGLYGLFGGGNYTGGVSNGKMSLVGEKGPELVTLPAGSRIHNNAESRRMGTGTTNNITVNVQGRVGASDAELRNIASKVSKMISTEINRTTSSSTRI